ncbi:hypothetical protein WJX73_008349 [Symbiochloris irregularis]|uniref:Asparagine synthetase [glutamine-hydrolyzing] n=1 Tax=Symbiochloris irregularis TaxID=706552 RepID=A0AAW1NME4_9CHLO
MCGILAALLMQGRALENRRVLLKQSMKQRSRGPDSTSVWQSADGSNGLAFERLNIIDPTESGRQPFIIKRPQGNLIWALNSEIYNHEEMKQDGILKGIDIVKHSKSDSAIIGHLYEQLGDSDELWNSLDGIFACVLIDEEKGTFCAARDPLGICPLYWGRGADGSYWFASEMKALQDRCTWFDIFPPGHVFRSQTGKPERWYKPDWLDQSLIPTAPADLSLIRHTLIRAVVKRLMSDAPLGVLLSGGLDSSLVAAITVRHMKEATNAYDTQHKLHTFSIGIAGSPDLLAARKVAKHLGTDHHEFTFTVQEGIDCLSDLIWHIESFEQVRAAVPMYLLARKIKAGGCKVVLSGEGADEIFGGYLYFHKAPDAAEFHRETIRKVTRLHQWDVLRANKAPFAWGLEPRVPFLDKEFVRVCMGLDPAEKMIDMQDKPDGVHPRMEKYLLRKAFDTQPGEPAYLPESVLWRQKEQFSDGVGYDWVDGLKAHAQEAVTDEMWESRAETFPTHTPKVREYYLLRSLFQEHFPSECALATVPYGPSIACSTPEACTWDPEWANTHEISGRAIASHDFAGGFDHRPAVPHMPPTGPTALGVAQLPDIDAALAEALPNGTEGAKLPSAGVVSSKAAGSPAGNGFADDHVWGGESMGSRRSWEA